MAFVCVKSSNGDSFTEQKAYEYKAATHRNGIFTAIIYDDLGLKRIILKHQNQTRYTTLGKSVFLRG